MELLGFWSFPSVILQKENAMFWKVDLFPFSGEGVKTPTQLGPLERVIEISSF
jgi:hypothetical protein